MYSITSQVCPAPVSESPWDIPLGMTPGGGTELVAQDVWTVAREVDKATLSSARPTPWDGDVLANKKWFTLWWTNIAMENHRKTIGKP